MNAPKDNDARDASRRPWNSTGIIEHINMGSLQRIADALEGLLDLAENEVHLEKRMKKLMRRIEVLENKIKDDDNWMRRILEDQSVPPNTNKESPNILVAEKIPNKDKE